MNVGLYLSHFDPSAGGGFTYTQAVLESIIEASSETSHKFTALLESGNPEDLASHMQSSAVKFLSVPQTPRKSLGRRVLGRLHRELFDSGRGYQEPSHFELMLRDLGIELMIYMANGPGSGNILDIPYIYVLWDLQHRIQPWFPEVSAEGTWEWRESYYSTALRRASLVVTGTHTGAEEVMRFYQVPDFRIKVIPFPVPKVPERSSDQDCQQVLSKLGIADKYLVYPAQLWPHKNHHNLLLALKKLRTEYHLPLDVVFVGTDKGNLDYLRRLTERYDLTRHVHFLGFVSSEDLRSLYENAFALTFVTFFGPDNLPPLEAFALGCPVIASAVSGAQEQLGDAALLVDPSNPAAIASAVKELWEDSLLRQSLVKRGKQRISKWTRTDYAKALFKLLDEFEPIRRCWEK